MNDEEKFPVITTYKGRPLFDMTRAELIEALEQTGHLYTELLKEKRGALIFTRSKN
jgi:hypothetical protein